MRLGERYRAFLRSRLDVDFLEGTTAAGKTTVGILKFFVQVARSSVSQHIIAGLDLGTVEKNIINKPNGVLDELGSLVEYRGGGSAGNTLPHIVFRHDGTEKTVYIMGYADRARWKKALGGQYGCLFIDEINVADMDFVREAFMRCDYVIATLNPDNPELPVYSEYVNRATPQLPEATPPEILRELTGEHENWGHWFFSFEDNVSLDEQKIERIKANVPKGTKLWKNKVLGLRGKSTGLVFPTYDPTRHNVTREECRRMLRNCEEWQQGDEELVTFTSGLDTAYSNRSADTIAMTFGGITDRGRYILLDCVEYDNAKLDEPLAPTDTVKNYIDFLDRNAREWGLARHCFIDSADQATITELNKYRRTHADCIYIFENAHKKVGNIDRIKLQLGWLGLSDPAFKILAESCAPYIRELNAYSWDESKDSTPEDANDHCIQSCQYSWLPYRERIGRDI